MSEGLSRPILPEVNGSRVIIVMPMTARVNPNSSWSSSFSLRKKIPPRVINRGVELAIRPASMEEVRDRPS